jgi:uncharacterized protein YbjT (DUF2867 family)
MRRHVFVTGGTGYIGSSLIPALLERGHRVRALARDGSQGKLAPGCEVVTGDALDASSFAGAVAPADTFVQLVGTAHPAPWKAARFRTVDQASVRASLDAARAVRVEHFVYLSVAQPAPVMKAYVLVRAECEALIAAAGLDATFVRPWYVLGRGHRWPLVLLPAYRILERLPSWRESAVRLGLSRLEEVVAALVWSVESPARGVRILDTRRIRELGRLSLADGARSATPWA